MTCNTSDVAACCFSASEACAQHPSGNLDNHQVEILCAPSAGVNVSNQPVDTANRPQPTSVALAAGLSRSDSAWLGRSQKGGLPSHSRGSISSIRAQGHRRALEGNLTAAPFNRERYGRQDARPCFACLPLALLRMVTWAEDRDVQGSGFFRARSNCDFGRSPAAPALTWTKTI